MIATLQRCRACVSVPASDATSVSMLEAMACGVPVVASDLPANRPWVAAPWRVPAGDAAALTTALLRLHDDPAAARALGLQQRRQVLVQAARGPQMDRMAALYRGLLDPRAAAGDMAQAAGAWRR
jgi:glycosyltransferase involved in cell wall biosynthesis